MEKGQVNKEYDGTARQDSAPLWLAQLRHCSRLSPGFQSCAKPPVNVPDFPLDSRFHVCASD